MELITAQEAASFLGVHLNTISEWVELGLLRYYSTDSGHFLNKKEVEDLGRALGLLKESVSTSEAVDTAVDVSAPSDVVTTADFVAHPVEEGNVSVREVDAVTAADFAAHRVDEGTGRRARRR